MCHRDCPPVFKWEVESAGFDMSTWESCVFTEPSLSRECLNGLQLADQGKSSPLRHDRKTMLEIPTCPTTVAIPVRNFTLFGMNAHTGGWAKARWARIFDDSGNEVAGKFPPEVEPEFFRGFMAPDVWCDVAPKSTEYLHVCGAEEALLSSGYLFGFG